MSLRDSLGRAATAGLLAVAVMVGAGGSVPARAQGWPVWPHGYRYVAVPATTVAAPVQFQMVQQPIMQMVQTVQMVQQPVQTVQMVQAAPTVSAPVTYVLTSGPQVAQGSTAVNLIMLPPGTTLQNTGQLQSSADQAVMLRLQGEHPQLTGIFGNDLFQIRKRLKDRLDDIFNANGGLIPTTITEDLWRVAKDILPQFLPPWARLIYDKLEPLIEPLIKRLIVDLVTEKQSSPKPPPVVPPVTPPPSGEGWRRYEVYLRPIPDGNGPNPNGAVVTPTRILKNDPQAPYEKAAVYP